MSLIMYALMGLGGLAAAASLTAWIYIKLYASLKRDYNKLAASAEALIAKQEADRKTITTLTSQMEKINASSQADDGPVAPVLHDFLDGMRTNDDPHR